MRFERTLLIAAAAAGVALSIPASAETLATAMMPLSIRSGPGPQYSVIGAIPGRGQAMIIGCIQGSMWCQVSYNGRQGWAYAQYLTARVSGRSLALAESLLESGEANTSLEEATQVGQRLAQAGQQESE